MLEQYYSINLKIIWKYSTYRVIANFIIILMDIDPADDITFHMFQRADIKYI